MNDDRRRQIEDVFEAALDEASSDRAAFLGAACAGDTELRSAVESLLAAHDRADGALDRPVAGLAASLLLDEQDSTRHIGPYRVLRELGRGGMGVVYLAERDDGQFRRRVAVKVVRSGFDDGHIQRRFLAERQILASLSHPNIAQLLDGGVTDGRLPYLVMEYVDGLPITDYCDTHRLGIDARLRLFLDVCAAVQHAHQNLVIHRDLKPANIVVDAAGRVKLLDFGIAKLLNPSLAPADAPLTRLEQRVMTLDYASPEQVRGEALTTASDVYSLGVILYELLCGHRPYRVTASSPEEIVQAVCTRDPERPASRIAQVETVTLENGSPLVITPQTVGVARDISPDRLSRELRGDLDAIVMMALRKEAGRRYGSAEMLGKDIERHFAQQPVSARHGNRRYHVTRFLRRRRLEVTAAGLVAAALIVGAVLSLRQAAVARMERDRAAAALAQAEEVRGFLTEMFRSAEPDPSRPADEVSVRDLLRRGVARADALSDRPAAQARLLDVIGQMQHNIGAYDEAARLLERAVAVRRALGDQVPLAESLLQLSWVHRSNGDIEQARRVMQEVLDIRRRTFAADAPEVAEAVYERGFVAATNQELEVHYREALAILQRTGARPEQQLRLMNGLATSLRRQGRLLEAVVADRRALDFATRAFGPTHFRAGLAMVHLADQVRDIENNPTEAERLYRQGLDLVRSALGPHTVELIHPLDGLGDLLALVGRHAEAEEFHREVVRIRKGAFGEQHPMVALTLGGSVAADLEQQGRLAEAETLARDSLATLRTRLGPKHSDLGGVASVLAQILARQGRHDEADALFREAIDLKPERNERLSILNAGERRIYGRYLIQRRRFAEAEAQLLESLRLLTAMYGSENHPNPVDTKRALMELYEASGQPALVERYRVPPGTYVPY